MRKVSARTSRQFVIHEHKASRLHFDFRLDVEGVLKSWALPKGPSMDPADKRLAIMVEDHPIEYLDFEGIIPEGRYGAGPVVVWDQGIYEIIGQGTLEVQLKAGKFSFILKGKKLSGRFTLTRFPRGKTEKEWLIIKNKDEYADSAWTLRSELAPQRLRGLAIKVPPCHSP